MKRVFNIDIETCRACGGAVRIIACIEDPVVIEKILAHQDSRLRKAGRRLPACSADAIQSPSFNPNCCHPQGTTLDCGR